MRKSRKVVAVTVFSALFVAGSSLLSLAAPYSPSTPVSVATNFTGWRSAQESGSTVWYYYQSGRLMEDEWLKSGQNWYYLGDGGVMVTGWGDIDGNIYYFAPSGAMATGWHKLSGDSYSSSNYGPGSSSRNDVSRNSTGWYYFVESGSMATGWKFIGTNWYYFADEDVETSGFADGQMLYGEVVIDDNEYYFGAEDVGIMQTGFVKIAVSSSSSGPGQSTTKSSYRYFDEAGVKRVDSWVKVSNDWYYLDSDGYMVTGKLVTDEDGTYIAEYEDNLAVEDYHYYYMDEDSGKMKTGWVQIKSSSGGGGPTSSNTSSYYQYYDPDYGDMRTR
jgi:glucan-binding YG repeat protein